MRQVLFLPNSLIPRTEHARRVGKPRAHWLIETYADAYRESGHVDQFDINNILQRNLVNELAQQRLNIFFWHSIAHLFTESFITESFVTESFVLESGHIPGPASEIIDVYPPSVPPPLFDNLFFSLLFRDSDQKKDHGAARFTSSVSFC